MQTPETNIMKDYTNEAEFEQTLNVLLSSLDAIKGEGFFQKSIKILCDKFNFDYGFIGSWADDKKTHIQSHAIYQKGQPCEDLIYEVAGTACHKTLTEGAYYIPQNVREMYPNSKLFKTLNAESYFGLPLINSSNNIVGIFFIISQKSLIKTPQITSILHIFSYRAAVELERRVTNLNFEKKVLANQVQLDAVPALIFIAKTDGTLLRWNKYYRSKVGYSDAEMKHMNGISMIHPDDKRRFILQAMNMRQNKDEKSSISLNGITKNGMSFPLLLTMKWSMHEGEMVLIGTGLDMTEQRKVEQSLLRSQSRLAKNNSQLLLINSLIEKLHAGHNEKYIAEEIIRLLSSITGDCAIFVYMVNPYKNIIEIIASEGSRKVNLNRSQPYPFQSTDIPAGIAMESKQVEIFRHIDSDLRINPRIRQSIKKDRIKSGIVIPLFYQNKPLGAITIGYRYESKFLAEEIDFYRTIGSSISIALANAAQYKRMENLASYDNLTNLPNRNTLNKDSMRALKQGEKNNQELALILIDLDRFKEINDTLDHFIGDKLLKLVAARINTIAKDNGAKTYRLGGDEFCVLVKNDVQNIRVMATTISSAIAKPFVVDGFNLEISSSIGIVTTKQKIHSSRELLRCAEIAMYHAKNNSVEITFYSPKLDQGTRERFTIIAEMADAIRNNDLVLHYQPKYDIKRKKVVGCEALIRWQHKKYGLMLPGKFMHLVELTQLIHPLTSWVMDSAFKQLQQWKQSGININMSINLSARNLIDNRCINQVDGLLQKYKIQPHEIEFEVTETVFIDKLQRVIEKLNKFKQKGILCSLDDYGTGFSSLNYIKNFHLDFLKIDSTFISKMLENKQDKIIAQSSIDLAHSLDMKVVAEGVENEATLCELAKQGCDLVQGFYISEPLSGNDFSSFYLEHEKNR